MSRLRSPIGRADHVRGLREAPIQLVEYADFECPYCGEAYHQLARLQKALGEQLVLVFRHFPLTQVHPHALQAAEAAEAAAAQNSFWEMHDLLFENQEDLEEVALVSYADQLGLDVDRFRRELDAQVYRPRIERDFMSGVRSGVVGTPGLFLDGERRNRETVIRELESLGEEKRGQATFRSPPR